MDEWEGWDLGPWNWVLGTGIQNPGPESQVPDPNTITNYDTNYDHDYEPSTINHQRIDISEPPISYLLPVPHCALDRGPTRL